MGKLLLVSMVLGVFLGGSACAGRSGAIVDTPTPELSTSPTPTVWPRLAEFEALAVKQCAELRSVAPADASGIFLRLDLEAKEANFEKQGLRWQVRGTCRDAFDAMEAVQATATPPPTQTPVPPATPTLWLEKGWNCSRSSSSYSKLEGQVTNRSSQPLRRVQVVVNYYATGKTFVTSDSALIEYDPLLPGQTSPFSVLTRYNPAIVGCDIDFKVSGGGTISYELRP